MKIGMIQLDIAWQSKAENYSKAKELIKEAASRSCEIVVLPEMFNTGFSMAIEKIGEELFGETSEFLRKAAAEFQIGIIGGYPVLENTGKGKNAAIVIDEKGNIISTYFKIFPFSFVKENHYYDSGQSPILFKIRGMNASVFICYDLRFPEIFRRVARNVHCIFVIANWPSSRIEHWNTLLKARAIENQCFVIGVNRIGIDGNDLMYPGNSHIISPSGQDLCSGSSQDELIIADIDLGQVDEVRNEFPFLDDMKITDEIN